ncbi:MAG: quinone-dependent dihydroorotate dehydrogenase [Actinomycetota bacterium]|nr:quinone-dependent dihydroorotate dehydrogenase [Actinomycetota bacterium]
MVDSVLDTAYRRAARPVLFRLGSGDAEVAHRRAIAALGAVARHPRLCRAIGRLVAADPAPRTVFGLQFRNAVGLAAGVDKDGHALAAWPALGFGFVEAGTVTSHPQQGNDKPRLFRLRASEAIVNRMGFNNDGAAALADRVTAIGGRGSIGVPLGISLGKSKTTPVGDAIGDYLSSLTAVHSVADYIAVNVSSPNTDGLRSLQDRGPLEELVGALTSQADVLAGNGSGRDRTVPVLVKISPDLTDSAIGDVLEVCTDRGVAGIIATNTTLARDHISPLDAAAAAERGGLSGGPLRRRALEVVRFVCGHTDLPVIGVGGISTADDGLAMLDAGASLLQLYSGFIYRGPALVRELNTAIAAGYHADGKEESDG